jgi:SAM-dependent methyltransferase
MKVFHFNKVCELEDFADPEMIALMRDIFRHEIHYFTPEFPRNAEYRHYWETTMSVRALRDLSILQPTATLLGVGAGTEPTLYYLTNHVNQVFATDLYLDASAWGSSAPSFMLAQPELAAPYTFNDDHLVVQHMDGRILRYPDDTFDGIFSLGVIGHFGSFEFSANAAYEMGRVLKPNGVLTLTAEYLINGPPGGRGSDNTALFSYADLIHYLVEASGLELVDRFQTELSDATLVSKRDLRIYAEESLGQSTQQIRHHHARELNDTKYAHLISVDQGYVFTAAHLALRKTDRYPVSPNDWAKPNEATRAALEHSSDFYTLSTITPSFTSGLTMETIMTQHSDQTQIQLRALEEAADNIRLRGWNNPRLRRLPKWLAATGRMFVRILTLGQILDAQAKLTHAFVDHQLDLDDRLAAIGNQLATLEEQFRQALTQILPETQQLAERQTKHESFLAQATTRLTEIDSQLRQVSKQVAHINTEVDLQPHLQELLARFVQLEQVFAAQVTQTKQDFATQMAQTGQSFTAQLAQVTTQHQQERTAQHVNLAEAMVRLSKLDEQLRLNTGQLRFLQQQNEVQTQNTKTDLKLTTTELLELLTQLDKEPFALTGCSSIEFSIQADYAEDLIVTGTAYWGDRMSSKGPIYRLPNDAWVHIDFTSDWHRPILFENSARRLQPDGKFVIVTRPEHDLPLNDLPLVAIDNRVLQLNSSRTVRIYLWQAK